ncbi:hypothetical protein J7E91_33435 [Streptomyces sp. ISL-99]|uniref:hypothetical protein n=1 Tax=Streptomyces sp. ISL-99 TaxID=2819193 RepID=UPI001BE5E8A7|nr:hypothetical protein [Streptomyces sp. ISL-99]MBT2530130.1 hypothetical protein [Streptomyces sp. ISL-99]
MPRLRRRTTGPWPTPRAGTLDVTCPAPSITPGYHFTLHLTGAWEELPASKPHHAPRAAATNHALTLARNITASHQLTDTVPAAARINTLLGQPTEIPLLPIRLTWAQVHLTAEPEALYAVTSQQRRLHDQELQRTQQQRRLDEAHALRDTLVADPSLALAYWFATCPETIDQETLSRVERLITTAATYAPQGHWVQLARLLTDFTARLPDNAKTHLVGTLATLADRYGHADIAAGMRSLRATQPSRESDPPDKPTA